MALPPQAIIYYFSGAGSTWLVAQAHAELLRERGLEVQLVPIELIRLDEQPPSTEVLVGIGMPVYGRGLPRQAQAWIAALPPGEDRSAFVFATCRQQQGKALTELSQQANERGYRVMHEALYLTPQAPWADTPRASDWLRADIAEAITQIDEGRRRSMPESQTLQVPAGILQRCYRLGCRFAPRLLRISSACNLCMTCLRLCPVGAISLERAADAREEQLLHLLIHQSCILCLRCAALCPQQAISTSKPRWLAVPLAEPGFANAIALAYQSDEP